MGPCPTPLVYFDIHSLPIESWVVDDEAISQRDRVPRGRHGSGSKLGPLRNRRAAVRIVTWGHTPNSPARTGTPLVLVAPFVGFRSSFHEPHSHRRRCLQGCPRRPCPTRRCPPAL